MIRVKLFSKQGMQSGGLELLEEWNPGVKDWVWVDIDREPQATARQCLVDYFSVPQLVLDDIHRPRHPPKLEKLADCWFLLVRELASDHQTLECTTLQLACIVGKSFVITAHEAQSPAADAVWTNAEIDELLQGFDTIRATEYLGYRLLRRLTDDYQPLLTELEEGLETIEEALFEHPDDQLLAQLLSYSRQLKKFRRVCRYHETHIKRLLQSPDAYLQTAQHEYNDIYEHQERLASMSEMQLEIANDLVNGYLSLSAHRLNKVMRVLTVVTVIFVPLTFIAGIYGMNFDSQASGWNMPELSLKYGYPMALGFMLAVAVALIVAFRRRKWL